MNIVGSGKILGARVEGLDLAQSLAEDQFKVLEQALGRYGVLSYPKQKITSLQLKNFAERFGKLEVNVANLYQEPGLPEVMILSNMVDLKSGAIVRTVCAGVATAPAKICVAVMPLVGLVMNDSCRAAK